MTPSICLPGESWQPVKQEHVSWAELSAHLAVMRNGSLLAGRVCHVGGWWSILVVTQWMSQVGRTETCGGTLQNDRWSSTQVGSKSDVMPSFFRCHGGEQYYKMLELARDIFWHKNKFKKSHCWKWLSHSFWNWTVCLLQGPSETRNENASKCHELFLNILPARGALSNWLGSPNRE